MRRSILTGDYRKDREFMYLNSIKAPKVHVVPKEHPEVDIYLFDNERNGRPVALVFCGKRTKADIYAFYGNSETREKRIMEYLDSLTRTKQAKESWKADRMQPNKLKVGDILYNSWGWEQTNIDFYQVVESKGQTVQLRRIACNITDGTGHSMAGYSSAVKDSFVSDEIITKRVCYGDRVTMKHGSCSLWDGKPKYCSWYA